MRFLIVCIFIFSLPAVCQAQDLYRTKNGTLRITMQDNGKLVKFHSNTLQINLNLKTAEFEFYLPINSLHTEIDSLNNALKQYENSVMKFRGRLNLDEIKTQPHEPYNFKFDANIEYDDLTESISGYGRLDHIPGREQPTCQLSLTFELDDFELIKGYVKDFRFQLIQSILYQTDTN